MVVQWTICGGFPLFVRMEETAIVGSEFGTSSGYG